MSVNETKCLSSNAETKARWLIATRSWTRTQLHGVSLTHYINFQDTLICSQRARLDVNMLSHGCVCLLSCSMTHPKNTTHELRYCLKLGLTSIFLHYYFCECLHYLCCCLPEYAVWLYLAYEAKYEVLHKNSRNRFLAMKLKLQN